MINCIAVDDEPKALLIIEKYIAKIPFLALQGTFRDGLAALYFTQNNAVDLVFLDIDMPDFTGIQFLKSLSVKPMIIFTTAHAQYAVESYEFEALDYLLKPIEFERFIRATNKANEQIKPKQKIEKQVETAPIRNILIKSGTQIHQVLIDDILYIEASGNYVSFVTSQASIMTLMTMQEALHLLASPDFVRVHKSYIIALHHLKTIEKHQVSIRNKKIPLGGIFRDDFLKRFASPPPPSP